MTTTVTIKHNGPGHHDVQVQAVNLMHNDGKSGLSISTSMAQVQETFRLHEGEEKTLVVYDVREIRISEVPKE